MNNRRSLWMVVLGGALLLGVPALADGPQTGPGGATRLAQNLPERLQKRLRRSPDGFTAAASSVILVYGGPEGIGPEGIETMIALDRARARARARARLLGGDLDNDGAVTRVEVDVLIAAASEFGRGRLETAWRQADGDGNGVASTAEVAAFAEAYAADAMPETEAEDWRALMKFDLDGNGLVEIDEILAVVSALAAADLTLVHKDI